MTERLGLLLAQDNPTFANWDQDVSAIEERYHEQNPEVVASELLRAADVAAAAYAGIGLGDWQRAGVRSNGSVFTVETLALYFQHDLAHHLVDVGA